MDAQLEELLAASLGSYRAALLAIGQSSAAAHPYYGLELQSQLTFLTHSLSSTVTPDIVRQTEQQMEEELRQWAERTADYFKKKTNEVKEILLLMVAAADGVSARDKRYTAQLARISTDLRKVSDLEDLTSIRKSLSVTSADLNRCVATIEQDGKETVAKLRSEVLAYQARVLEVERIASSDALTGLANRREVERQLELRVGKREPFCVMLFDLNDFKLVNDSYGHGAGDDVLIQFAGALRRFFRKDDAVGRWGGDEFIVVLDGDMASASKRIAGLEKRLYGDYTIRTSTGPRPVRVSAVAGAVDWLPGETAAQVVEHADAAMYRIKRKMASR